MNDLALRPVNANVYSVHSENGTHIGNLKRVGAIWKFKAIGYGAAGEVEPGGGPLTDHHNTEFSEPDAQALSAALRPPASSAPVTVEFAASLRRHVPCPPQTVASGNLRTVLDAALAAAPELAHYVLDDQGHIRKHVAVFINKTMVLDRQNLDRAVAPGDAVLVIQALTGG
jgi:hypothetical protein